MDRFVNFFWRALNPPNTPQRLELSPVGAWDGVGTARTTQSGRYDPEKLSPPAGSTELRWGPFLPVPAPYTATPPLAHIWRASRVLQTRVRAYVQAEALPMTSLLMWV